MNPVLENTGYWLARYLQKEVKGYKPSSTSDISKLKKCLKPGDILLVEGNLRISVAIKYLTQSTWSHAAFYTGPLSDSTDPDCLIEADALHGVSAVPLSKYAGQHTRICRPVDLTPEDTQKIFAFMTDKIGMTYDMKNAFDLLRYLLPQPPVPARWRRRMLALGSGDPTRAICSTLIAQAFQHISYPILPDISTIKANNGSMQDILHIRHHSLFTPRDFDISPYFKVVKPTIEAGFEYKNLQWHESKN
ncbi:MAG: lipo-like protein [Alphaproteobacteria bacterium]|nr:lipo-like protein [Alphaproteobacteria bacterium]